MERASGGSNVALVAVLSLLASMSAMLQTIVVPVLGQISEELGVGTAAVGWLVTANLLAAAVFTPVLSKLGDTRGRRRVLLGITLAVALSSLVAAATLSYPLLVLARVVQGASFVVFPLSIGVLRQNLTAEKLPLNIAVLAGAISVGAGIGLVVTGVLSRSGSDYRIIFWFMTAVALVLWVLAVRVVPSDRPDGTVVRIDWFGATTLAGGLVLLLLVLTQGNSWGWTSMTTALCTIGSVVLLFWWWRIENKVPQPLVPPWMMRNRALLSVTTVSFLIGFGTFVIFLGATALVQVPDTHSHGFSASVLKTSVLYLLPGASIGIVASPVGGVLVNRIGIRATLLVSSAVITLGFVQLAFLHSETWHVVVGGIVTNAALTMGFAAVPSLVVETVPLQDTALANAVTTIARSVGSSLGSALVVAFLAGNLMVDGHPSEAAFTWIFWIGALSGLVAVAASLVGIPRSRSFAG